MVLLVKPQFEVGRDRIGKKGVVRDPKDQAGAIATVLDCALELGWHYRGLTWSPLVGPAGNIEYLLWLSQSAIAEDVAAEATYPTLAELQTLTQQARSQIG